MKANVNIEFKRIGKFKVNEKLFRKEPKLKSTIEKTLGEICSNLEKYFTKKNIKIKAKYDIEKW